MNYIIEVQDMGRGKRRGGPALLVIGFLELEQSPFFGSDSKGKILFFNEMSF